MGFLDAIGLGQVYDFAKDIYNEHKEGQARDEARTVRGEDVARDQTNFERGTLSGRVREGQSLGISKMASIGASPNMSTTATVGLQAPEMNKMTGPSFNTTAREEKRLLEAQTRGVELDNLKKQQDLTPSQPGRPDNGGFMPGSKSGGRVIDKPQERTATYPGKPHMEAGAVAGLGFEAVTNPKTGQVMYAPIPSGDVKQRIEDSPYETRNFIRDAVSPYFGNKGSEPPRDQLPSWANDWRWNGAYGAWEPFARARKPGDKFLNKYFKNRQRQKGENYYVSEKKI